MKKMETIFLIIIIIFALIPGYLCWMNRGSDTMLEKVLPAMAIGVIVVFFTLWFTLKEVKDERKFPVTYMINEVTGETLDRCDEKYERYYTTKRIPIRRCLTVTPRKDLTEQQLNAYVPQAFDHLFIETIGLLFSPTQESGDALGITICASVKDPALKHFSGQFLNWNDFIKQNRHRFTPEINKLYLQLEEKGIPGSTVMTHMCLPYGTTIDINCNPDYKDAESSYRTIKLKNDFCEIDIKMFNNGFDRGLREWKWILGYNDSKDQEFLTHRLGVRISTKFDRFRSGHPDMPKYKKWSNILIDRLQSYLDSKQQLEIAREKYHLHKDNINKGN